MGCLSEQTSGTYFLNKELISRESKTKLARLRNEFFGFVMQDFALVEHYTVKQNITLPLIYVKD